ncbi:Monooxygenase, FAD-binding protein [Cordyceps fumosorosea ARSEF 2679]|uniref:Monooxygenase, FAD-binding protein n=1 Tax=Cordyceps fumosorosea (strain ARSEF 2679) TaxID=1081104 RepID=A0A168EIZ9_CORFA|nr:Monooxygenase, FAD-binding protein [Cordyceps fumosorosea ARSEF 2679]OAA73867.1 Monooxygenase, FAD-binding protein [Cordyceps fumosorosea ARSEF 2679]
MAPDAKHFLSGRTVFVCGAGISGLTFVLSLLQQWDPAVPAPSEILLVDTDDRAASIARGAYDLQLNADTEEAPLVGLRDLGLLDAVLARATTRTNPDAVMHVWDKSWKSLTTIKPKVVESFAGTPGVRIRRAALLEILVEAVEARTTIRWGTAVQDAQRLPDGTLRVSLLEKASGAASQRDCDLLVAADGDESTLRRVFRPNDDTKPIGYIAMGGQVDFGDATSAPAPLTRDFGIIVGGDGVASAVVQLNNAGKLLWSVFKEEKKAPAGDAYDNTSAAAFQALLDEARATSKNIAEPLPTLIAKTKQETSFRRPVREREAFGHEAAALRGVVFLGDANRHVSVYMNNGGALAVRDGIDLARALVAQPASVEAATAAYDKTALPRSTKSIKAGRQTMNTAHLSGLKWTLAKTALSAGSFFSGQ